MKLLKGEGIGPLLLLIEKLTGNLGKEEIDAQIVNNPEGILSFLPTEYLVESKAKKLIPPWSESTTLDYLLKISLTDVQKKILIVIDKNPGITLEGLAKKLKGSVNKCTNRAIGGAFGGLSKKCKSYRIPVLYKVVKEKYYITPRLQNKLSDLLK